MDIKAANSCFNKKEWILPYKFRFKFRCSYIYNKV